MRHQVFGKKLNRDIKERKALFKNLVLALINHGKIRTSIAKGKAIQRLVEKMVTSARNASPSSLASVSSFLARKKAVEKLVKDVVPRFKDRAGGYLRLRRVGVRKGDSTEEVILEWSVGQEKQEVEKKEIGKGKVKALEKKIEKHE